MMTYFYNDVTDRRKASVRPTFGCSFLIFPTEWYGYVRKKSPSLVFSGDRNIPTLGSTVPVRNEVSLFMVDPRVGFFLEPLKSNGRLFFPHTI